jgi:hypothetical protein
MKLKTTIAHISIPAIFATGVFIYVLGREPISVEMVASVLFGGFIFYAAPYLFWAALVAISKPSNAVAHSGFIASTLALALVASVWFFPPDPSGLPMQWMLYWPLAIILLITITGGTAIYLRINAPNKALKKGRRKAAPLS